MARRSSGKIYLKDEDFQEEEIWGLMEKRNSKSFSSSSSSSSSTNSRHLSSTTPRMIPRKEINNISSNEYTKRCSAPVIIPNRQMIMVHGYGVDDDGHENDVPVHDVDDDDDEIVPPHEYIARRLARTQISSFSVCEGIGRKLKGRDLSEVRNDVLRKTGFLE